jgi:cytochrome c oxidase subunit 2
MPLNTLLTHNAALANTSIFDPASPPAESIRSLAMLVLAVTAVICVIVEFILIYSIVRFRRRARANGSGAVQDTEPPQVYGSKPIEIAWTAAPALIVFVLALVTARTIWDVKAPQPQPPQDNALFVTVIGRQWWWEYRYDYYDDRKLGFTTANELHVPVSEDGTPRPVWLTLQSADVCHEFWVPRLAGKTDLIPGRDNHMWFQTKEQGLYLGQCGDYCGTQHANMLLRVNVDSPADFENWLANQQKAAVDDAQAETGKTAFLKQSCVNCHRVRGTVAKGNYAPDLTHLMSRDTLASGMIPNNPKNLRDWVANPQSIKSGCLMPAFGLSDDDCDAIVAYLLTLR